MRRLCGKNATCCGVNTFLTRRIPRQCYCDGFGILRVRQPLLDPSENPPVSRHTTHLAAAVAAIGAAAILQAAMAQGPAPTEATTAAGDKILIYPDGRWEYADPAKRATAPTSQPPATPPVSTPAAGTAAVAGACPPDSQGHVFWLGRCILPGEKDYNRGSLSGKGR